MLKGVSGAKLVFYDLHGGGFQVQVMADARFPLSKCLGKSKKGELSIFPKTFVVLSHCLHIIPKPNFAAAADNSNVKKSAWVPGSTQNPEAYILKDQETRYRLRHLDLTTNPEVRETFKTRSKIISYIRSFLDKLDFFEDKKFSQAQTCKQEEIEAIVIATGVHTFFRKAAHLVDNTNNVEHFQMVLKSIGNFCMRSIVVGMLAEIIVMYRIQHRRYRDGGISIAMPSVLYVTMTIGFHKLSPQGAITKSMTVIEEMADMVVLCSDKTENFTL
ncbi:hypothetical protein RYX36_022322 [Vicia faba]